ncbi:unnamed protein product, partial [Ilex paraguariensis]
MSCSKLSEAMEVAHELGVRRPLLDERWKMQEAINIGEEVGKAGATTSVVKAGAHGGIGEAVAKAGVGEVPWDGEHTAIGIIQGITGVPKTAPLGVGRGWTSAN